LIAEYAGDADALSNVIKARRERLSLSSGITDQIVGICQQILAFGAAGIALTVGFIDKIKQLSVAVQKLLAIIGIFYSELVVLSLLVLLWYMLQARFRYPSLYFENIGNAWPFFYYATIAPVARAPIQTAGQRFAASVTYAKDFASFSEKVLKEAPKERLRAELQQYFLSCHTKRTSISSRFVWRVSLFMDLPVLCALQESCSQPSSEVSCEIQGSNRRIEAVRLFAFHCFVSWFCVVCIL
jgi:hypothetical protein